jgi:hypothetical protein
MLKKQKKFTALTLNYGKIICGDYSVSNYVWNPVVMLQKNLQKLLLCSMSEVPVQI